MTIRPLVATCLLVVGCLLILPGILHAQNSSEQIFSLTSTPTQDVVRIDLAHREIPEVKMIAGKRPRVYFELYPVYSWNETETATYQGTGRFIEQMRTCFYPERESVRIVIDLAPNFDYTVDQYHVPQYNRFTLTFTGKKD